MLTYRMLAGRMPFDGSYDTVMLAREILSATPFPLRQLMTDLPLHVEAAITQALAKDKGLRFPSVLDFVRALHGLPLSSTVHLRRDAAVAPPPCSDRPTAALLDYGDRPTAALLDYSDRPTAALLDYNDRPTAALQLGPELTAMVASSRSPPVEETALLPVLPVAPERRASLAASAATPAQPPRPRRWRWRPLAAALGLLALGAAASIGGSRPRAQSSGLAPRAEPASLAEPESLQSRWPHAAEATTPALSSLPGRTESAANSTCSCAPPLSIPSACPVSGGAGPSPGHRPPPTRHKLALKPVASAAVRRYLNRPD